MVNSPVSSANTRLEITLHSLRNLKHRVNAEDRTRLSAARNTGHSAAFEMVNIFLLDSI